MNKQAPVEDIHAIVGRFQAWSGTQTAGRPKDDVRELTYEEAIKASRHRSASKKAAAQPVPLPVTPVVSLEEKPQPKPKKRTVRPRKEQVKSTRSDHRGVKFPAVSDEQTFRQVLVRNIPTFPTVVSQSVEIARPAALSIRVSAGEQALIKARAAEANLSVSAYLRQCALEVEQLRTQLQQVLVARQQSFVTPQLPAAPSPGPFVRLTRWFFSRRTTSLAVRA
jgi:hypothetical protein